MVVEPNGGTIVMTRSVAEAVTREYLTVPGARLSYEVSGAGPVLLIVPGGPADAASWAPFAPLVEDGFTVVRYDPRGISHSRLDDPVDVPAAVHADDAARLLETVGDEPAYVLGHSGGAIIALALVERHPELVQTLVAHEPPLATFLPAGDPRRAEGQAIYETYLAEGGEAAMARFMASAGMDMDEQGPPADLNPEAAEAMAQAMASIWQNLDFFFAHYLLPITSYEPNITALKTGPARVVVGIGEDSAGQETYDTSLALAERLGSEPIFFPGDHIGMTTHPEAFAETLREVFRAR
jgi:pimeloyl-ACP methyl ester carboxylesterase